MSLTAINDLTTNHASDDFIPKPDMPPPSAGPTGPAPPLGASRSGSQPGPALEEQHLRDGYGALTATVFLSSVSVGANLLNVPQGMAHLGWLAVPFVLVLSLQSCFTSHLLACCWTMVEALDPALSGPVHQPYPLIADRVLGTWARHMTSLTVMAVDTLTSVMLLVLASDLVATIITYAFPRAEPTICLMIILLATFLCPFTWFQSPKNFWMVGVVGLATSLSAWLLLLMKMCADFCQRTQPPPRGPPTPLRMMVGMSSLCSSFISAGVQPTIQADMRDRTAFSGTLTAVWIVITVMVLSFGVTSYILIGSDAKSNVVHNLEPGRLLLAIQILMLTHVLTSFVLYINPLYQELEEKLSIPEDPPIGPLITGTGGPSRLSSGLLEHCFWPNRAACQQGSWRQYSFRALCMGLLVLVSEALPDFGHVLDIISVLAITITLVLPPLLYLRLAGLPRVDLKLRALEKAFLVFLVVTGLVCALVAGFGTTSFVFVEQQQGSCFQPRHLSASNITGTTTPASRAIIFKQILTFKPATIA